MPKSVISQSVAVLVFGRDREKGEKIVSALAESYQPSLVVYEKGKLEELLQGFDLVVAVMAVGIVVRSLCGHLSDKWTDRPIVAVDSTLCCAVPVVGGHHGANDLAMHLGEHLGLFPAITTATSSSGRPCLEDMAGRLRAEIINKESSRAVNLAFLQQDVPVLRLKGPKIIIVDEDVAVLKSRDRGLVVGVGARKGVLAEEVLQAIDSALEEAGRRREEIGWLATATLKRDEIGISEAARILGREVLYLTDEVLNAQSPITPSTAGRLGLSGVAEPAVLALATRIILPKKACGRVTVALGE
jgi:cobalt-precorrin 5A hydrolase